MTVEFDRSFLKSIDKISNKTILRKVEKAIEEVEKAQNLSSVSQIKKLSGFKNYYRIRLGDYRLGLEEKDNATVRFIIIAHRKEIYRFFP
jgi:mRNA interferase RelE/StbE